MNRTTENEIPLKQRITVDTPGLMALCSCGKQTALEIGKNAGAMVKIGKRTLWSVLKLQVYFEMLTNEKQDEQRTKDNVR